MKQSEIIIGHSYSNGRSNNREEHRDVISIYHDNYQNKDYVTYKITYINSEVGLIENLRFHILKKSFARWAKKDVT